MLTQTSSPVPIKSLNPYRSKSWTIRARVTHKSDLKLFKTAKEQRDGKVFSIDLVDEDVIFKNFFYFFFMKIKIK